jgi:hypothetical protein
VVSLPVIRIQSREVKYLFRIRVESIAEQKHCKQDNSKEKEIQKDLSFRKKNPGLELKRGQLVHQNVKL